MAPTRWMRAQHNRLGVHPTSENGAPGQVVHSSIPHLRELFVADHAGPGKPLGLALDVIIITPHVGGQAQWRNDKITDLFCQNLVRWKQGRPLINFLSDKRLGFPIRGGGYPLWGGE